VRFVHFTRRKAAAVPTQIGQVFFPFGEPAGHHNNGTHVHTNGETNTRIFVSKTSPSPEKHKPATPVQRFETHARSDPPRCAINENAQRENAEQKECAFVCVKQTRASADGCCRV
jgi:hypothetical protein